MHYRDLHLSCDSGISKRRNLLDMLDGPIVRGIAVRSLILIVTDYLSSSFLLLYSHPRSIPSYLSIYRHRVIQLVSLHPAIGKFVLYSLCLLDAYFVTYRT